MNLDINQTKLIGLIMELELKTKEYKMLCEKLDKLKQCNIDENDDKLLILKNEFVKNNEEIEEINRQIRELKSIENNKIQKPREFEVDNIFKQKHENKDLEIIKKDNFKKNS